jgi:hypothetical protein
MKIEFIAFGLIGKDPDKQWIHAYTTSGNLVC